jgi:hypothetical protein
MHGHFITTKRLKNSISRLKSNELVDVTADENIIFNPEKAALPAVTGKINRNMPITKNLIRKVCLHEIK